jgi:hypothetical protein
MPIPTPQEKARWVLFCAAEWGLGRVLTDVNGKGYITERRFRRHSLISELLRIRSIFPKITQSHDISYEN